jgi:hypothetical protein
MKTFNEIARKFFAPIESNDAEFVFPECWKPKTQFQASFLNFAKINTAGDYSDELRAALSHCIEDFTNQHTITKTEILFDGNLNFTITVGESSTTATSGTFSIENDFENLNPEITVDGEQLPSRQDGLYTGMTAQLVSRYSETGGTMWRNVMLSYVDADTFTNGPHHVVISITTYRNDIEPKTYKELMFANGQTSPITENKMLPKTPEELAFALLTGTPVEFSSDSDDGGDE